MQASNKRNETVQYHTLNAPALKGILMRESNIQASSVNDHIEAIQQRKRQELNDYLLVCHQRLKSIIDPVGDLQTTQRDSKKIYSIIKKTSRGWCD